MPIVSYAQRLSHVGRAGVLFHHIPKCGGLSLAAMLKPCFSHACGVHHNILSAAHVESQADFFYGHGVLGLEAYLPKSKDFYYITFLRHPYSLVQSLVHFSQWLFPREDFFAASAEELLGMFPIKNFLIHYLGQGDAARAEARLFEEMAFFGLQEEFSTSITALSELVPTLAQQEIVSKNMSAPRDVTLSASAKEAFFEVHAADIALYEKAVQEFKKRTEHLHAPKEKNHTLSLQTQKSSTNKAARSMQTVQALRESVLAGEDILGMHEASPRFENWLHILMHAFNTEAEQKIFFTWLMQRAKQRASCLFFAFFTAYKAHLPELPFVAKELFSLCMQRDAHNALRVLVQCRFHIVDILLARGFWAEGIGQDFKMLAIAWLHTMSKQGIWHKASRALQEKILQIQPTRCSQAKEDHAPKIEKNVQSDIDIKYEFSKENVFFLHML